MNASPFCPAARFLFFCALCFALPWAVAREQPAKGAGLDPKTLRERLQDRPEAVAVLDANPIQVKLCDATEVPYEQVLWILGLPDALSALQAAYVRTLPAGTAPEFEVRRMEHVEGGYFYINRQKERTEVLEIVRGRDDQGRVDLLYFARGRRFFGDFSAVIAVLVMPDGDGTSRYQASIFARPDDATVRFFARHLHLVEMFFRTKTAELNRIFVAVVREAGRLRTQAPSPNGDGPT